MLNTQLQTLHIPEWDRVHDINISEPFPPGMQLGFTRCGYRLKNYRQMKYWENSPTQSLLMLQHSIDDIELTEESSSTSRPVLLGHPGKTESGFPESGG